MAKGFTYKSYNFTEKDPIIDEIRTVVQGSGATYKHIEEQSGVCAVTLRNWFDGKTRKPQAATINAVLRSLGYKLGIVPYEVVPIAKRPPAVKSEPSTGHAVRMAKIRAAR
jgi:hypothetical protein